MPRPFPFALGIGTDICQITRINQALCGPNSRRFLKKLFNSSEMKAYTSKFEAIETRKNLMECKDETTPESKAMKMLSWQLATFVSGR
jgi:phosphopantetheinyl transferase (holo-ACP synthase)